ncbi:MAG: hypothetical protein R2694_10995 [Ilumatobacteraceae bacterium]
MTVEIDAALAELIGATSLAAAQHSHDWLLDAVLPGRAAVAVQADEVVAAIRTALPDHPFPVYLLAVLRGVAQWVGVWSRLDAGSSSAETAVGDAVEAERRTRAELRLAASALMDAQPFGDPEARALTYLLIGAVLDDAVSVPHLIRATEAERDRLAAACGVEAVAVALARSTRPADPESVSWVRLFAATDSVTRSRMADAPLRFPGVGLPSNTAAVESIIGEHLAVDGAMPRWPSECF